MKYRPLYGKEYTTRLKVNNEQKREMLDDLSDGLGFVI